MAAQFMGQRSCREQSDVCVCVCVSCSTHERCERWKIARAVHSKSTCILDDMPSRERRLACSGSAGEIDSACATTRPRASLFACHELSTQAPPCSNMNIHVIVIEDPLPAKRHANRTSTTGLPDSKSLAADTKKESKKRNPSSRQPYPCKKQKPAAA
jgi:hypothetical protein